MSKLGTYRNKNVYDYNSLPTAIGASIDNDILSVYWISGSWGKMFWKGMEIAHVQSDSQGLHVIDFDEELWSPKKKEAPVPPPCVKEVSVSSGEKKEEESIPVKEMEVPLYDIDWYKKVMGELNNQWAKIRPTFGTEEEKPKTTTTSFWI